MTNHQCQDLTFSRQVALAALMTSESLTRIPPPNMNVRTMLVTTG